MCDQSQYFSEYPILIATLPLIAINSSCDNSQNPISRISLIQSTIRIAIENCRGKNKKSNRNQIKFKCGGVVTTGTVPAAPAASAPPVTQRERPPLWKHSPPFRDSACGDSVDSERGSVGGPLLSPVMESAPQSSKAARQAFGNVHTSSLHTWVTTFLNYLLSILNRYKNEYI